MVSGKCVLNERMSEGRDALCLLLSNVLEGRHVRGWGWGRDRGYADGVYREGQEYD